MSAITLASVRASAHAYTASGTDENLPKRRDAGFMTPMLCISLANAKGGTAKTSTTIGLASALSDKNVRVLVVDLDDQANATKALGLDFDASRQTVGDLLLERARLPDVVLNVMPRVDIVPAWSGLLEQSNELLQAYYRQERLSKALSEGQRTYDICLIDCPPARGVLTANALFAADWMIVPMPLDSFSYDGLHDLLAFAESVRRDPVIASILVTQFDARNRRLNRLIEPELVERNVLNTRIPICQAIRHAQGARRSLAEIDPSSSAWKAYLNLAEEVIAVLKEAEHVVAA